MSMTHRIVVSVGALVIAGAAGAGVVGPPIPIWVAPETTRNPAVAFNPQHEEFLVVWENEQGPSTTDVYARRIAIDGTPRSWFAVKSAAGEYHGEPTVAANPLRDEYLVCWTANAAMDAEIACSPVAWDGSSIGPPGLVVSDVDTQWWPRVIHNPHHDEYVLVHTNFWTGGTSDVAATRIAGDGTVLSRAVIATGATPNDTRMFADIAFNADLDEYMFIYVYGDPATLSMVRAKIAPADLAGVSVAPELDLCPFDLAYKPVASWGSEGYLAVWWAAYLSPDWLVSARHVTDAGVPLGPPGGFPISEPGVNVLPATGRIQAATWAPAVGHVVAYLTFVLTGGVADISARVVSPSAERLLGPQLTVADGTPMQLTPALACAPWGVCLVAYEEDGDIVARILRFHAFADGFDETGDTSYWSAVVP